MEGGEKFINVQTGMPLFSGWNGFIDVWAYSNEMFVEVNGEGKALDRGWAQSDGILVGRWTPHGAPPQKFRLE